MVFTTSRGPRPSNACSTLKYGIYILYINCNLIIDNLKTTRNAHTAKSACQHCEPAYRMPFSILRRAANFRPCKMPTLLNKVVESAESPVKSEDYLKVNGLRLVRRPPRNSSSECKMHTQSLFVWIQVKPYYFDFLCSVKKRWLGKTIIDVFSEVYNACICVWFLKCQCATSCVCLHHLQILQHTRLAILQAQYAAPDASSCCSLEPILHSNS